MKPLSPRQTAILDAIEAQYASAGIAPTHQELCRATGITSTSVVARILDDLEGHGLIRRTDNTARSIVLVDPPVTFPPGVRDTLLMALQIQREECGRTPANAAATRWVKGG